MRRDRIGFECAELSRPTEFGSSRAWHSRGSLGSAGPSMISRDRRMCVLTMWLLGAAGHRQAAYPQLVRHHPGRDPASSHVCVQVFCTRVIASGIVGRERAGGWPAAMAGDGRSRRRLSKLSGADWDRMTVVSSRGCLALAASIDRGSAHKLDGGFPTAARLQPWAPASGIEV